MPGLQGAKHPLLAVRRHWTCQSIHVQRIQATHLDCAAAATQTPALQWTVLVLKKQFLRGGVMNAVERASLLKIFRPRGTLRRGIFTLARLESDGWMLQAGAESVALNDADVRALCDLLMIASGIVQGLVNLEDVANVFPSVECDKFTGVKQ